MKSTLSLILTIAFFANCNCGSYLGTSAESNSNMLFAIDDDNYVSLGRVISKAIGHANSLPESPILNINLPCQIPFYDTGYFSYPFSFVSNVKATYLIYSI